jgi:uncharacterized protein YndB with AHSA1/START domain
MTSSTDRIEKQVLLHAPLERVWRAISDAQAFGSWFGVRFDGPFVAGEHLAGRIVPTTADPEVAASQEPYEGRRFDITVARIEPMRLFSFRWRIPRTARCSRLPSPASMASRSHDAPRRSR